jgi:hypothetical protein
MAASPTVISHWHHTVEDFNTSAIDFYSTIERDLLASAAPVSFSRTMWNEGGLLSARRTYLRVGFQRFNFDICAAPFGKSFFFSWWLTKRTPDVAMGCLLLIGTPVALYLLVKTLGVTEGLSYFLVLLGIGLLLMRRKASGGALGIQDSFLAMPLIGPICNRLFKPVTYYSEDTRLLFEESVHRAVLKGVEGLLAAKGARALGPDERRAETRSVLR